VQGVGFRPLVYYLAQKFNLTGWVNNAGDGVHIQFNADKEVAMKFYDEVISNAPKLSCITSHSINEISPIRYKNFQIIASNSEENPLLLISPDFAMCDDCRREISDKSNRRYNYAFTTCTQCGPRYSIIKQLPYDRENTAMDAFKMCSQCNVEYNDATNRRHFSQTNSCPNCPVQMKLYDGNQNIIEVVQANIISKINEIWNDGKILGIKGIGGYLLTCDASNEMAINELRKRKHRPAKPFALMFPNLGCLENEVESNERENKELESVAAPIVLLRLKEDNDTKIALHKVAPELSKIGVMLPYAPMFNLLLQQFKKPIVATSGNISNAPIIYKDDIALNELNTIADYILIHKREIIAPQDDSVVQYSKYFKKRIVLRRARGFVPLYRNEGLVITNKTLLATGAMMKSNFTLLHQQNIHISQYLGDTNNYDTQNNFENSLNHFLTLFKAQPEVVLTDKHTGYFSHLLSEKLSKDWNIPVVKIQHHEAHFASVLGENNILEENEPILGVIWDGAGFGNDRQIWGGEFFTYYQQTFLRTDHFEYFNHILADKMAKEPRLAALSICVEMEEATNILQKKFSRKEWRIYTQIIKKNELKTSSIGRLFDAVASIIGLINKSSFEGEAAMLLEEKALLYFKKGLDIPVSWLQENLSENILFPEYLILQIIKKIKEGKDDSEVAAWFHVQLVVAIKKIAFKNKCRKICFSGGVFQNGLLIDIILKIMAEDHKLYFNKEMPPNDENISFGQLIWYAISEKAAMRKKV
jgi:hydrogenase maturation protein HypF